MSSRRTLVVSACVFWGFCTTWLSGCDDDDDSTATTEDSTAEDLQEETSQTLEEAITAGIEGGLENNPQGVTSATIAAGLGDFVKENDDAISGVIATGIMKAQTCSFWKTDEECVADDRCILGTCVYGNMATCMTHAEYCDSCKGNLGSGVSTFTDGECETPSKLDQCVVCASYGDDCVATELSANFTGSNCKSTNIPQGWVQNGFPATCAEALNEAHCNPSLCHWDTDALICLDHEAFCELCQDGSCGCSLGGCQVCSGSGTCSTRLPWLWTGINNYVECNANSREIPESWMTGPSWTGGLALASIVNKDFCHYKTGYWGEDCQDNGGNQCFSHLEYCTSCYSSSTCSLSATHSIGTCVVCEANCARSALDTTCPNMMSGMGISDWLDGSLLRRVTKTNPGNFSSLGRVQPVRGGRLMRVEPKRAHTNQSYLVPKNS